MAAIEREARDGQRIGPPVKPRLGPGWGRARIGEAVGQVGDALGQLALKQMEAINISRIAEAQNIMTASEADIAEATAKERDETKWSDVTKAITAKTKERIGKLSLSPPLLPERKPL